MLVGELLGGLGEGAEAVVERVIVGVLRRRVVVVIDVVKPVCCGVKQKRRDGISHSSIAARRLLL